jgi:hypothetical protein
MPFCNTTKRAINAQGQFVADLESAYEHHPFPDYLERLEKERARLERMQRYEGAWIIHLTFILTLAGILTAIFLL